MINADSVSVAAATIEAEHAGPHFQGHVRLLVASGAARVHCFLTPAEAMSLAADLRVAAREATKHVEVTT